MLEARRGVRNLSTIAGLRVITRPPLGRLAGAARRADMSGKPPIDSAA